MILRLLIVQDLLFCIVLDEKCWLHANDSTLTSASLWAATFDNWLQKRSNKKACSEQCETNWLNWGNSKKGDLLPFFFFFLFFFCVLNINLNFDFLFFSKKIVEFWALLPIDTLFLRAICITSLWRVGCTSKCRKNRKNRPNQNRIEYN